MQVFMKIFNILIFVFSFLIAYHLSLITVSAQDGTQQFTTNYETSYEIDEKGVGSVSHNITLINNTSKVYASSYSFTVIGKKPENIKALSAQSELPIEIIEENNQVKINIIFPEAVVGKNKIRNLTLSYKVKDLAIQNGEVWDLTIPRLADSELISESKVTVSVPLVFGNLAYISPQPKDKTIGINKQIFFFEKEDLVKAGIVAAFGQFQVYSFHLNYHLVNSENNLGEIEIALPPDTAFQRVFYDSIVPYPKNISLDTDGNWIAKYELEAKEEIEVKAIVNIQLFANSQEYYPKIDPKILPYYLSETNFWQTNNLEISEYGHTLKTPKNIYEFVVGKLSYDYKRVTENVERFGSVKALQNPNNAICTEFTDLFIALARSAGIPAREINGYAYTDNPTLQPLSLVADVLHAWPEYWNGSVWKPIDPTWEDTTNGIDFFDKFDLSHVTFVIHGKNSEFPLPAGSYKSPQSEQKDIQVQFGKLPDIKNLDLQIQILSPKVNLPILKSNRVVRIYNPGPTAVYNTNVKLIGKGITIKNKKEFIVEFIAPYSTFEIPVEFTTNTFSTPSAVLTVKVQDKEIDYKIQTEEIYLSKLSILFGSILIMIAMFFGIRFLTGRRKKTNI